MRLDKRPIKQKLFLAAVSGYAVSIAMRIGLNLGMLGTEFDLYEPSEYWIACGFLLIDVLFLVGLLRPEKWKKLLALSLFLQCGLWWVWYGIQSGDVIYALMSFPINIAAEALLISYILSTRRGKTLRIMTGIFLELRMMETVSSIVFASYEAVESYGVALTQEAEASFLHERYLIRGLCMIAALLIKYGALLLLVLGLDRKGERELAEKPLPLKRGFLDAVEREKTERLCLECGESNSWEERTCRACGKELTEGTELFENFPDENSLSSTLRNAYDSLKRQDWISARECCETAMENGENSPWTNLGILLAELEYESFSELLKRPVRLELQELWQKTVRAAEGETKERLKRIRRMCFNLYEQQRLERQYAEALELRQGVTVEESVASAKGFARISGYRDAREQAEHSLTLAQERVYRAAMEEEKTENWREAQRLYESIPEWEDAARRGAACQKMQDCRGYTFRNCKIGTKLGVGALCLACAVLYFFLFRL